MVKSQIKLIKLKKKKKDDNDYRFGSSAAEKL